VYVVVHVTLGLEARAARLLLASMCGLISPLSLSPLYIAVPQDLRVDKRACRKNCRLLMGHDAA
jgi:hypothetical protein